jgi:TATA-box binding protein (TBP) (component of TFIID and TFIIIB)
MTCIDDEWENFLSDGSIILSNEKSNAKSNIKKSYSVCDKLSDNANNIDDSRIVKKSNTSLPLPLPLPLHLPLQLALPSTSPSNVNSKATTTTKKSAPNTSNKCKKGVQLKNNDSSGESDDDDGCAASLDLDLNMDLDDIGMGIEVGMGAGVAGGVDTDTKENIKPICSDIYISTKTKISYLNTPVDIKKVFWSIPISPYSTPQECVIKKQIKVSTTDPNEVKEIKELLKNEKYYHEQEIEHIDNPEGRIKFKVQTKINIGLCKKDILNYRCKLKRAFFNCFVLIIRVKDPSSDIFKEMHVKVFNTGKLEIPGIQSDESLTHVLNLLIGILKPIVGDDIGYIPDKCETVLINSNFNCGYFINRDKLFNILKYKYRIHSNYDSCSYPGIQCKFYYVPELGEENQTGQKPNPSLSSTYPYSIENVNEISFMIFRTGSVLIVGRCGENVLYCIYNFLKKLLETEYLEIGNQLNILEPKKHNTKLRKKTINVLLEE